MLGSRGYYRLIGHSPSTKKLLSFAAIPFFILLLFIRPSFNLNTSPETLQHYSSSAGSCSPQAYAQGSWSYHPKTTAEKMTSPDDALAFSGFEKCASSREYYWHLASDKQEQWDRFPGAQSWEWIPGKECKGLNPLTPEDLVRTLVEDGGWYLVGDSVTENHFFSLSCILYPYVFATPNYTLGNFDRAWIQNLYLNPTSPLLSTLSLPAGFDPSSTPLVTFRRIDLLLSKDELISIHNSSQLQTTTLKDTNLFSDDAVWTLPVTEYLDQFLAPLPKANYATMVVSTAGHWTTTVFSKAQPPGIKGVLKLFEVAMERWAEDVQSALLRVADNDKELKQKERRVIVRAYLPGHENCHDFRHPWDEVQPYRWNWYNWSEISQFNAIFEKLLLSRDRFPNIHYLGIDRPARLRPDAHTTGDCLHIMTGAGVLEGWTHYIWQYITREIPRL